MKNDIHSFGSLPGVKGGKLKGPMAKTINGFMTALRSHRICADAGDYGSVMVYRDDDDMLRCYFMVWHQITEEQSFATQRQVRQWLKEWLPAQRQAAAA